MNTLPALLAEAERLFADYRAAFPLAICQCGSCMPPEEQRAFLNTPPAKLSAAQLYGYNGSVPLDGEEEKYIGEIKRFLPRILRTLCAFEEISPLSETALHHLNLQRRDCWTDEELDYLQRFARAFIAARCTGEAPLPSGEDRLHLHNADSIGNYLLMFHWAGLPDLHALTDEWAAHARELPALRDFIELLAHTDWTTGQIDWHKAFYLPEHCPARDTFITTLQTWLDAPATRRTFRDSLEHAILNDLGDAQDRALWESWYDWLEE